MKSLFRVICFILVICTITMYFSCSSTEEVAEPVAESTETVVPVIATEPAEAVLISTQLSDWKENSFSEESQHGYFFTTAELGQFAMIEGEFKKSGGYEKSGFGFVFGYSADEEGWLSDYIRFEINTSGEYAIFANKGSSFIDLVENHGENTAYMYTSSAINTGYDSVNKLKILKTSAKAYDLYINGSKIASITVPDGYGSSDGVMAFFSVGKQNQEQFPEQPVRVTYRITDSTSATIVEK